MRLLLFRVLFTVASVWLVNAASADDISPFTVHISDEVLTDLQLRLSRPRYPPQLYEAQEGPETWKYGTNLKALKDMVQYWRTQYNWREREAQMNKLPQFTTQIDGLRIHFVHARSSRPDAVPMLFSHGWPGSFLECAKILPLLTEPVNRTLPAFHLVCPSLPGYGFSDGSPKEGMSPRATARIFAKLMAKLKYDKYVAQGGDWGSIVSTYVGVDDPAHCAAVHLNWVARMPFNNGFFATLKTLLVMWKPHWFLSDPRDIKAMQSYSLLSIADISGYMHLQATRPQSLSYGLTDSPVGLLGYLMEKYRSWSDSKGDLSSRFSNDEVLDLVMLYWAAGTPSGSILTSFAMYYEVFRDPTKDDYLYVSQPTGVAAFAEPWATPPKLIASYVYNIVHYTHQETGGHFAALEEPVLLSRDVQEFVSNLPELFTRAASSSDSAAAGAPSQAAKKSDL